MPLVLKVCGGTWEKDNRDKRELSAYRECGFDVAVLAKGEIKDKGRVEDVDGFKVYRYSTRPLGQHISSPINRAISLFTWARYIRKINPDIITGHDLLPGLTISWISTWFVRKKPKLIYDSHEFEIGRNAKRSRIWVVIIKHWEKFLMKRCVFSIMVNDSIADEVQKNHSLNEKPVVVRSTPDYWNIDDKICAKTREYLITLFWRQN